MKATFNETIWNVNSCFDFQLSLTIIVSWGPSLTQMPAPRHIHLTCMLRMAEMTVSVFYRVTMDKVVRTPRITHLMTVTLGSCGCSSDVIHTAKSLQQGLLKKIHTESRWSPTALSLHNAYNSKCAAWSQSSLVSVSGLKRVLRDWSFLNHSCQYGTVKMFITLFQTVFFYVLGNDWISFYT